MNRRLTLTAATLFLGLGAVAMSACGPTASGSSSLGTSGTGTSDTGTQTTGSPGGGVSAPALPATGTPHASGSAGQSGSNGGKPAGGSGGGSKPINPAHAVVYTLHFVAPSTTPTDSTPVFVHGSVSLVCVSDPDDFIEIPGQGKVHIYHPQLSWETKNATNMALSVDNPDLVGAYDTYSWHGSAALGDGCYKNTKQHQLDLYAIGSDGKPGEHIVITEAPGLLDYPTPPPFGGGVPNPSPSS